MILSSNYFDTAHTFEASLSLGGACTTTSTTCCSWG